MAGKDNLISLASRTTEAKREIGIKGAMKSNEVQREKRKMKEVLEMILARKCAGFEDTMEAICFKQVEKALEGDNKSFELVRDTTGNKPIDQSEINGNLGIKKVFVTKDDQKKTDDIIDELIK